MHPKFFYGYVILALCFANMVVMRGVNGAFGVYFLALLEEFPWSRSAGASIASANFFVYAIASPLVGLAFDRFGPRVLMPLGAFLTGLGLVLSSFAHSLGGLYFTYGIVTALGQGALSFVGHNALISFWFVRKRATAIGIASMGQGLGALVMVPATQMLVSTIGWRWTYVATGGLLLLVLVPANAFFQRRTPAEVGQFRRRLRRPAATLAAGTRRLNQRDWTPARPRVRFHSAHHHRPPGPRHRAFHDQHHAIAHFVAVGYEKLAASYLAYRIHPHRRDVTWGSLSDRLGRSLTYGIATGHRRRRPMIALTFGAPGCPSHRHPLRRRPQRRQSHLRLGHRRYLCRPQDRFDLRISRDQLRLRQRLRFLDRRLPLRRHRHLRLVLHRLSDLLHHLRPGNSPLCPMAREE
jgi:MFS family permease